MKLQIAAKRHGKNPPPSATTGEEPLYNINTHPA
jgi:hypothetical protein